MALNFTQIMPPPPQAASQAQTMHTMAAPSMPNPMAQGGLDRRAAKQDWRAQRPQFAPGMDRAQFQAAMQGWRGLKPQFGGGMDKVGGEMGRQGMQVPPMMPPQVNPGILPQGGAPQILPAQSQFPMQTKPQINPGYALPQQANPATSFMRPPTQMQAPLAGKPSSGMFGRRY